MTKSGRMTAKDKSYILDNHSRLTIEEISKNIGKNPKTVEAFIKEKTGLHNVSDKAKSDSITKSPIWKEIRAQFSDEELEVFLYHWNDIHVQFNNDVYATERLQIVELCRIEVLINRTLKKMKEISVTVEEMRKNITEERAQPVEMRDMARIDSMEAVLADIFSANINFTKEYKELLERKQGILKEIKGTREQRIKRIEDSKETITSWVTKVLENPEIRRKLGVDMEKFRLATQVELERLSDYFEYMDGTIEQPILNADTIKEDNK